MKKPHLLLLILTVLLPLSGCSSDSDENPTESTNGISTLVTTTQGSTHDHTFNNAVWEYDLNYHWHPSVCGHDVTSIKQKHIFENEVVSASFEKGGYTKHTCKVCGYSYVDSETPQLVHDYSDNWSHNETSHWHICDDEGYVFLKAHEEPHSFSSLPTYATYEHGGYTTHTCSVCGYSYVDSETPQLVHNYSDNWSHNETSHWRVCEDEGYGNLKSNETMHTFNNVVTPATYEHGGYTTHTCSVCGYSYVDSETNQLAHNYSDDWSHDETNHWHICTDEGYEHLKSPETQHEFREVILQEPTCFSAGLREYICDTCLYSYIETLSLTAHNWSKWYSNNDATCTADGTKYRICETCLEKETVTDVGSMKAHDWMVVESHPATCEDDGWTKRKCAVSSNLSHATLSDLVNEKTKPENCSSSLIKEISKSLNMSMDSLYDKLTYDDLSSIKYDKEFDLFKSNICHELHSIKYRAFLKHYLTTDEIEKTFEDKKYKQALYLVAMIDYLCETHNLPIPTKYNEIRNYKLDSFCVSESLYRLMQTKQIQFSSIYRDSISTFRDHNIIEMDVGDVA